MVLQRTLANVAKIGAKIAVVPRRKHSVSLMECR